MSAGPIDRRRFLELLGAGAAGLMTGEAWAAVGARKPRKPNIIVILADDLGYADLGCQGAQDIPTPHIDSLAHNGVRFTNGYVSCPVCSPTRAGLMTGRYQQRFGHEFNPGPPAEAATDFGLPLSEVTIADVLKGAGYATGLVGKWHLGLAQEFHPLRRGFDEFFGFLHGAHSYVDPLGDRLNPILRSTKPVDEKEYLTDAFTREASSFIRRHGDEPFFLYLSYNAVHTPLQAPQKYLDRFPAIADSKRRTYAAMLSAMDDGVGAVIRELKNAGLYRDTLVLFLSDNGGPSSGNASSNAPLSGVKGTVLEGGIRVPFILQWPRRVRGGHTYGHPVTALDILPTAAAAGGGALRGGRAIDGVNLIPHITGEKSQPPHDVLFWRFGAPRAVRRGEWKLIAPTDQPPRLYNLTEDIGETDDRAEREPGVVASLAKSLAAWESQLSEPLWQRSRRRRQRAVTGRAR